MAFDYSMSGYAICEDIPDAHREIWGMIGGPGSWWPSEDRIAFIADGTGIPLDAPLATMTADLREEPGADDQPRKLCRSGCLRRGVLFGV